MSDNPSNEALAAAGLIDAPKPDETPAATTPAEPAAKPVEEAPKPNEDTNSDEVLGEKGIAALKAEREARKTAEGELKRLNDRLTGADSALTEHKANAEKAQADAVRYKLAFTHGLSQDQFDGLPEGLNEEQLEAVVKLLPKSTPATRMAPNPTQGASKPAGPRTAKAAFADFMESNF